MTRRLVAILIFTGVFFTATAQIEKFVPGRPSPSHLVNDFTGTLTWEQWRKLEDKAIAFNDSTGNQISMVMLGVTGGYPLNDLALAIFRKWRIGSKEKNNGILVLISKYTGEVRIETGYGLEGTLPDITAKRISLMENAAIFPALRNADYNRAFNKALNSIIKATKDEYTITAVQKAALQQKKTKGKLTLIALLLMGGFFVYWCVKKFMSLDTSAMGYSGSPLDKLASRGKFKTSYKGNSGYSEKSTSGKSAGKFGGGSSGGGGATGKV